MSKEAGQLSTGRKRAPVFNPGALQVLASDQLRPDVEVAMLLRPEVHVDEHVGAA